ncbi:hypothetical protein LTR35_017927 [Friedmanniomyces endolithicus]|nr:hypothetical protein LTR35_017927 [Friedmanniomyces endolithicus]
MEKLLSYMDAYAARLVAFTDNLDGSDPLLRRLEQSHSQGTETFANSDLQTQPADAVVRVSGDHRTGPHKLLSLWPRVNSLLDRADVKYDESYVIEAEDRVVLRVHTRGEGIDEYDGTRPGGPVSPARSEESSGESNRRDARTPPDDFWGIGFRQTHMSDTKRFASYGCGGSESDGTLDVDSKTIDELYEDYMAHLHNFPSMLIYHLMHLRLKVNLDFLQKSARQFTNPPSHTANESSEHEILENYVRGRLFAVALWHAQAMLSMVQENVGMPEDLSKRPATSTSSRPMSEPPHLPYCIYFSTLTVWYGEFETPATVRLQGTPASSKEYVFSAGSRYALRGFSFWLCANSYQMRDGQARPVQFTRYTIFPAAHCTVDTIL